MADVQSSTTAAPASAASASAPSTLGGQIDAEITILKSRIASLESAAKTDWSKAVAWAKSNWAHIALTWPAAIAVLKPVVADLMKAL